MKTIEFFSTVPGVAESFPIKHSRDCLPRWTIAARNDYMKELKNTGNILNHVYRCPGIFDLLDCGFIVSMWHDVIIKTNGNLGGFSWTIPNSSLEEMLDKPLIGTHVEYLLKDIPKKPGSLEPFVKINTPWRIVAPKNVKFIILPIAYPDSFDYESVIGILDPAISSEMNFHLRWNKTNDEILLKAGTPLCQIIPLTPEKFNLECRYQNQKDLFWLKKEKYLRSFSFQPVRALMKKVYYQHFSKD